MFSTRSEGNSLAVARLSFGEYESGGSDGPQSQSRRLPPFVDGPDHAAGATPQVRKSIRQRHSLSGNCVTSGAELYGVSTFW
jgi:hypothetical protein